MSSVYITCYPKVGSTWVKNTLNQHRDPKFTITKEHRHMHIDWVVPAPEIKNKFTSLGSADNVKIIYLCANPFNSVLSYINKWYKFQLKQEYVPNKTIEKIDIETLAGYENLWASSMHPNRHSTGPQKSPSFTWSGDQTWDDRWPHKIKVHKANKIRENMVSYIINQDLFGYQEHFDSWTKSDLPYERCIVKYESLVDPETVRCIERFLDVEPHSLKKLTDRFAPRKTNFSVESADNSTISAALFKTYRDLANEISRLDGFTQLTSKRIK